MELNALDNKNKVKKILSVLDFKKAIPVCENCYEKLIINKNKNRDILIKEYKFLKRKSEMIENKMRRIINDQKSTGNVKYKYCDFTKLEKKCDELKEKYSNDCIK